MLKREMEHMVISVLELWCPVAISNQASAALAAMILPPQGLINKANCATIEENRACT